MKKIDPSLLAIAFSHKKLCTRCGTCVGVCPTRAISCDEDYYPVLNPEACTECGLCERTCPGGRVDFKQLTELTFGHRHDTHAFDGHVQRTYVGYGGDDKIRKQGAGGGVITALLWDLLNRGVVDGCVVTRIDPQQPWRGQVYIARSYEALRESQQSKYMIIPVNEVIQSLLQLPGKFAYACLPCQVHGLRLYLAENPEFAKKIHVIIGLYCASSLEPFVAEEMLACKGIPFQTVKNFNFRGGQWPGRIRAILKDGRIKRLHYSNFKDGAINYLTYLYSPERCQTCIDGSAEFADISVSDAWTRDETGKYLFESHSKLIARTDLGVTTMLEAISCGALIAEDVTQSRAYKTHKLHTVKKGMKAPLRVARLHHEGKVAPLYDRAAPRASRADIWAERVESAIMALGRRRSTRMPLFKFLTSRYGTLFVKIRQWNKSRKYRNK